ncbi:MAG: hypothetical protein Q4G13_00230 [Moraxella sp.]|nr:hypothetical protein [Moraxella sp.]
MLNGQYVGCTTGFSQSDKTDIFIPNQTINTTATPYLQRLVAVNLIKVETQTVTPTEPIVEIPVLGEPILEPILEPVLGFEPTLPPQYDGFWNVTSRIDAYEKAGERVRQMGDSQRFYITLANPDGSNQIIKYLSGSYLKHRMFGNNGGLYTNAQTFTNDNELMAGYGLSVGFNFVNDNGVPTGYGGNGDVTKPYPNGAGIVSLEIQGKNEFKIVPTGADNDLVTIFGLEQPRFVTFTDMARASYIAPSSGGGS